MNDHTAPDNPVPLSQRAVRLVRELAAEVESHLGRPVGLKLRTHRTWPEREYSAVLKTRDATLVARHRNPRHAVLEVLAAARRKFG